MATITRRPSTPSPRTPRSDGEQARRRLLHAALRLFADKGFAKTSTREIAQAAGVNIAAISYYFGDKTGLYRATFTEPLGSPRDMMPVFRQAGLTTRGAIEAFFTHFLEPMKQGELVQQCLRLHLREMLEPSSQWAEELRRDIQQPHAAIVAVLCRHFGLARADDDVHRLAFSISSLAVMLFVNQEVIQAIRPALIKTAKAVDAWTPRLIEDAMALIDLETRRRGTQRPGAVKVKT
ncbi:TetR family transcriptional regulator [Rhodoferax koreense]|uniref:TetR family transcriptional regulator n=1 Tax=Rhodoferax koreensis TaxID=1842727 RepID=A0A1P8K2C5_9BURK|nr:CerR family C-terminal domain-containing protein [Rhodoferax koreense]APW40163.1 TetR family transcriptional regulator [Rhodoferax koreense]